MQRGVAASVEVQHVDSTWQYPSLGSVAAAIDPAYWVTGLIIYNRLRVFRY